MKLQVIFNFSYFYEFSEEEGPLGGFKFVITGTYTLSRKDLTEKITSLGGRVMNGVTKYVPLLNKLIINIETQLIYWQQRMRHCGAILK
jgi:NAD-dependent DNA ligase